jgi:hypothetical protein
MTKAIFRLELPNALVEQYEALASVSGKSFDEYIALTLERGIEWSGASYPITEAADKEIRGMLGGRIDSADKLVEMIRRLITFHIGGWRVEIKPAVQEQIFWALKSMGKEGDAKAAEELIAGAIAEKFRV